MRNPFKEFGANPYDPETQEDAHLSWNDGWASIHYHEDDE